MPAGGVRRCPGGFSPTRGCGAANPREATPCDPAGRAVNNWVSDVSLRWPCRAPPERSPSPVPFLPALRRAPTSSPHPELRAPQSHRRAGPFSAARSSPPRQGGFRRLGRCGAGGGGLGKIKGCRSPLHLPGTRRAASAPRASAGRAPESGQVRGRPARRGLRASSQPSEGKLRRRAPGESSARPRPSPAPRAGAACREGSDHASPAAADVAGLPGSGAQAAGRRRRSPRGQPASRRRSPEPRRPGPEPRAAPRRSGMVAASRPRL